MCGEEEFERDDKDLAKTLASLDNPFDFIYDLKLSKIENRTLYFSRHGESEYNVEERIGGDPDLTPRGQRYAKAFANYMNALELPNITIWTSKLKRAIATADGLKGPKMQTDILNEIDAGSMDGFTYSDIEHKFPKEWVARVQDKLRYRYPEGESYLDCCIRIVPLLLKMESQDNLVVVAHQAILRCIFGYLLKKPIDSVPFIKIPQHTIIQVTLEGDDNIVDFIRMPVEHVEQGVTHASQDHEVPIETSA